MSLALIIDDEADLCRLMQMTLKKMGIESMVAYDFATGVEHLANHHFDFCLTDMRLPDGSGLDLVKLINKEHPTTPVAVITAHGSMDLAIEALKLGAFDFVNKPLELPRLRQLVENALKVAQDVEQAQSTQAPDPFANRLIGHSEPIEKLKATIQKLARSQAPVFLWGESGTGKEVVAKLIHDLSPRASASFVPVNCGAIPSELMESEFFGHKKGSFTGATTDKEGLFQQANGGTLFLDEVADLPLAMQVKLLRAIQEKKIRPIGGTQEVAVDIRLLSATHKNLARLVDKGEFRQDLYYRINVIEVILPSLNDRKQDIGILAKHFLQLIAQDWGLEQTPELTDEAEHALLQHHYSGNVRELRNMLERAITLSDGHIIGAEHLNLTSNHVTNNTPKTTTEPTAHTATPSNIAETSNDDFAKQVMAQPTGFDTMNRENIADNGNNHTPPPLQPTHQPTSQTSTKPADTSKKMLMYGNGAFDTQLTVNTSINIHGNKPEKADKVIQTIAPIPAKVMGTVHTASNTANTTSDNRQNTDKNFCELPPEGLEEYLLNQERQLIITALNQTGGNKTKAAQLLNTTFRSLRYRMKKLCIDSDDDTDNE
ncbi:MULTISPECIES: sigma 54-interacting transcriptional regulator [unclassified Moraxella]|uniref:sigma 54-interacting transcriptional regulator n=1 Tax=unclassified Moraxella TaxID=2685852 RepID=UPI003AF9D8E8